MTAVVDEIRVLDGPPAGIVVPSGKNDRARNLRAAALDNVEVRENGDKLEFVGHAAVFGRLSEDLGGFKERIVRGAFQAVLDTSPDVRFLSLDHGGLPLARTSSGTMELREDPTGLRVYAELAPIQASRDLKVLIQRRDLSQMSFGFSMGDSGKEVWTDEDGQIVRTISQFGRLFDVSPVTFPAYAQTDASMRSLLAGGSLPETHLREMALKVHRGEQDASVEERAAIDAAFARIDSVSPWWLELSHRASSQEPEWVAAVTREGNAAGEADSGGEHYLLAARKRRLRAHGQNPHEGTN